MNNDNSNIFSNQSGISLWDPPEESTYYDRKMDLQGEVPTSGSMEEAKMLFKCKYRKTNKKNLVSFALFLTIVVILLLTSVVFYEKTHAEFDKKISGKEAIVISETATIHYDEPLGRNTDTVTKSKKLILTGKVAHFLQDDMPMMEVRLEDGTFAWISKRDIAISE